MQVGIYLWMTSSEEVGDQSPRTFASCNWSTIKTAFRIILICGDIPVVTDSWDSQLYIQRIMLLFHGWMWQPSGEQTGFSSAIPLLLQRRSLRTKKHESGHRRPQKASPGAGAAGLGWLCCSLDIQLMIWLDSLGQTHNYKGKIGHLW